MKANSIASMTGKNLLLAAAILLAFVGLSAMLTAPAYAAPGDLDPTFGEGGKVTIPFNQYGNSARALVAQPDGKLVAAGNSFSVSGQQQDFALMRYNANGTIDMKASNDFDGRYDTAQALARQPNGKLIVVGASAPEYGSWNGNIFAVSRYNSDGTLDTTFSDDGKTTTPVGVTSATAFAVAVQPDGKVVAAGESYNTGSGYDVTLVRYNADGSLDTTFSGDGKLTTSIGSGTASDAARSLVIQPNGKIVVAGSTYSTAGDFALARYNADGTLDTSFDGDGKLTTAIGTDSDFAHALELQTDGKLVAAGESVVGGKYQVALARYNPNGSLDTAFSGDGKLTTNVGPEGGWARDLALQPDGKLVTAGTFFSPNSEPRKFGVIRYNINSSLDTAFSNDGIATTDFGSFDTNCSSVVIQPSGKIAAAGNSNNNSRFALARFMGDNTPPLARSQPEVSTDEDTAKLITLSATDENDDNLTYEITALPANGKLYKGDNTAAGDEITTAGTTLPANKVTYVPNAGYDNTSSTPDTFKFRANDGTVNSNEGTVSITVAPVANLNLLMTRSADEVRVGDEFFYEFSVLNGGPSDATGIRVIDYLPDGVELLPADSDDRCALDEEPGSDTEGDVVCSSDGPLGVFTNENQLTEDFSIKVRATEAAIPQGEESATVRNDAYVEADQADPDPTDNEEHTNVGVIPYKPKAELSLDKYNDVPDDGYVTPGEEITYTIEVTSDAESEETTAVEVVDFYDPNELEFVSASAGCGDPAYNDSSEFEEITCDLGDVAPGETKSVEIVLKGIEEGYPDNDAFIETETLESNERDNSDTEETHVTREADLNLEATATPSPARLGGNLTYEYRISNQSAGDGAGIAENAFLVYDIDENAEFVREGSSQECSDPAPFYDEDDNPTDDLYVECDLGDIEPGAEKTVSIVVKPKTAGELNNLSYVERSRVDPDDSDNEINLSTTIKPADATAPTSSVALSREPSANGWHNEDVTVTLSAADEEDGSGVEEITYTVNDGEEKTYTEPFVVSDEGKTTISYHATDESGNAEEDKTLTVKLDKTAPATTCDPADADWHKDDVQIACTAVDATSGLADADKSFSLATDVPANTEMANASTNSRPVTDVAGNEAVAGPITGIKIDKKAPGISVTAPEQDATYGLRSRVAADYACTDGGSGLRACSGPVGDGQDIDTSPVGRKSFTVTATDGAGNNGSITRDYEVADDIPPVLDLPGNEEGKLFAEAASGEGAEVEYAATATDDDPASPKVTCDPAPGSTFPLGETVVECSATDAANNEAAGSFSVVVRDTTAPTLDLPDGITAEATGADGATVEYTASASDAVDEDVPADCSPASGETFPMGETTVACSATDEAGNKATGGFKVTVEDTTAPTIVCGSADANWSKENVGIACTAGDAASGLADPGDAEFVLSTSVPGGTETEDASTNSKEVCDAKGNCATAGPISGIKVDKKAPAITLTTPPDNASYNLGDSVAADYSCSDGGSGVGPCAGPVANGGDVDTGSVGQKNFAVAATDAAGNTATLAHSYAVNDNVAPDTSISDGPEGATKNNKPTFFFDGSDNVTDDADLVFSHKLDDDGEWSEYSSDTSTTLGGADGLPDGAHTFYVRAKDAAGNVDDSPAQRSFTVDAAKPTVTATASEEPNEAGWHKANVAVTLEASDGGGSDVASISYRINGNDPTTVEGATGTVEVTGEGETRIAYFATDKAGNDGDEGTFTVKLDKGAPIVQCDPADADWHKDDVSVGCTASDAVSGLADADESFSLSTSVPVGTETGNASTGSRAVTDAAGNAATVGPVSSIKVDKKAPAVSIAAPAEGATFEKGQVVKAAYGCSDAGSGPASCSGGAVANGANLDTTSVGPKTFEVKARDAAGNETSATRTYTVRETPPPPDTTAPTGTVLINNGAKSTKSASVTLNLSASDNPGGSGVGQMRFSNDGTNWSAWEPYATSKAWKLTKGKGTKTIHADFRDGANNVSARATDTINVAKKKKGR